MTSGLEQTQASSYAVYELLALVEEGRVRLPQFQRGHRWGPADVAKLFDSIYKDYPVGTLLLWKRPGPKEELTFGTIRLQVPERTDALWVVDGQQRITSLATALLSNNLSSIERDLYFDLRNQRFLWFRPGGSGYAHLPVREAYKLPRVMAWLREQGLSEDLQERAFRLADRLRNYRIPTYAVETKVETDLTALREIFDRINTFGKRMTRAEVFNALTSSDSPKGRDLTYLGEKVASLGVGTLKHSTLMMCLLSVDGPDVLRDFRSEFANDSARLSRTIERTWDAIGHTIAFLNNDARVPHLDLVSYQNLTVALVRFFSLHHQPSEWERVLLRRWYWRAAVSGPLPKLGSTGTLRLMLNTIDGRSAIETVLALLEEFPDRRQAVKANQMHWSRADTKTALCAMANLEPLVPGHNGEEPTHIDVGRALNTDRDGALRRVIVTGGGRLAGFLANRVFWQPDLRDGKEAVATGDPETSRHHDFPADPEVMLGLAGPEVLASHAISASAATALRRGDADGFLKTRHADLQQTTEDFVDARAEWEHPARHPLASI